MRNAALRDRRRDGQLAALVELGVQSTQVGPHKCKRVKPGICDTILSRPDKLPRDNETIHKSCGQNVEGPVFHDAKILSRKDTLTQDMQILRPEVETWKQRALAAEAMAGKQGEILREKMIPELTEFAKQSLVQGLVTQRNVLLETQRKAQQGAKKK